MLHDERLYKNPDRFMPASGEPEIDPSEIAFGYGRRCVQPIFSSLFSTHVIFDHHSRCPGMHFAKDELYLAVAQIGATFKISKALDAMGREIEPKVVYTNATVR
jgi:cytochrome P450